ncbi:MAG: DUF374 domain-containing protein [Woeseiaceae bacterium]|nr:DUF374 domain-containing protein [Woeseiaceae bacterium]
MSDKIDYSDVESRRSKRSGRRMSLGRRTAYAIGKPLMRLIIFLLTSTYRIDRSIGADVGDRIIDGEKRVYVPIYWHGHQVACAPLIKGWIERGFKAAFVVSASVDGEVPASIARSWGGRVIRGSAHDTGALVLRDAVGLMREGVSIVNNPDGPLGPGYEVKTGTVLVARMGDAPIIPIVCAASSAWTLDRWDRFLIPRPFAKLVVAVGEPIEVPKSMPTTELERMRDTVQAAMEKLLEEARARIG